MVDGTGLIAKSLVRQWIGPWWNENYLNLGILDYLKYLGMEAIDSNMSASELSYRESVYLTFYFDTFRVNTPSLALSAKSDTNTNKRKGATMLRMMEQVFPPGTLQKALQIYVKTVKKQEEKTDHEAFFQMLQEASENNKLNVSRFMHSWCDQGRYPLVTIKLINESFVQLSQEKFTTKVLADVENLNKTSWQIPITIASSKESNITLPQFWLEEDPLLLEHNASNWIMINTNATGYYRVLYDEPLLKLIQQQMERNGSVISPLSRAQLLNDYFVFAWKNHSDIQNALDFTRHLLQDKDYIVWRPIGSYIDEFYTRFSSHPEGFSLFQKYINKKLDFTLNIIGIDELPHDSNIKKEMRARLVDWACVRGEPSPFCAAEARKLLEVWKTNGILFKDRFSKPLSCAAAVTGGKEAAELLYQRYETLVGNNGTGNERENVLRSLSCATEKNNIVQRLFNAIVDKNCTEKRKNDGKFILSISFWFEKPKGDGLLPFLRENLDKIVELYQGESWENGESSVSQLLNLAARFFYSTRAQMDEIALIARENKEKLPNYFNIIQDSLEAGKRNVDWMETTGVVILEWLRKIDTDKIHT